MHVTLLNPSNKKYEELFDDPFSPLEVLAEYKSELGYHYYLFKAHASHRCAYLHREGFIKTYPGCPPFEECSGKLGYQLYIKTVFSPMMPSSNREGAELFLRR